MKNSYKMNVTFNTNDVNAAIGTAWSEGLLCGTRMQKIAAADQMSQSDFCPACQAVVGSLLMSVAERRVREELVRRGLSPESLQITND